MLARCTSSLDLHMLIVPYWYLFRTLLVPKVALGGVPSSHSFLAMDLYLHGPLSSLLSVSMCLSAFSLSVCLSSLLSVSLPVCLFPCLSVCLLSVSLCLSACLSVSVSLRLSVCLSLSLPLSLCLSPSLPPLSLSVLPVM